MYFLQYLESSYFSDESKKKRYIFYRVPYLPHEETAIMEVKMKLVEANIFEK